jgi:guanosine-3',5'-bis(diphosphate) 3'-pyrophosphohydrolase
VEWDKAESDRAPHLGRVSVIAANAPGALAAVANAVAKQDGTVVNLKIASRQQDFIEILADVEVRDVRHLTNVIAGLRAATGVAEAERARG